MKIVGSARAAPWPPPTRGRLRACPSIDNPRSWPSHISSSCATCRIANASPTTPSRRSSDAERQPPHHLAGIVSQYDVVCICCSGRSSSPGADVLVRVELDLLEADDARDDVDFAVRAGLGAIGLALGGLDRQEQRGLGPWAISHRAERGCPDAVPRHRKRVQNRDLRVRDRRRVVVAIDLRARTPCGRRSRAAPPGRAGLRRCRSPFRAASTGPLVKSVSPITRSPSRHVDDDEVVRRDRPQADGVGRIRLLRPLPLAVGEVHEAFLAQHGQNLLHVDRSERLVGS